MALFKDGNGSPSSRGRSCRGTGNVWPVTGRRGSSRSRRAPSPAQGSTHGTSSTESWGPRPSTGPGLGELLVPSSRGPRLAVLQGVSREVPRLWAVLPRAQRTRPVSPPAPAVGGQLGAGCRHGADREPSPQHRWPGLRVCPGGARQSQQGWQHRPHGPPGGSSPRAPF